MKEGKSERGRSEEMKMERADKLGRQSEWGVGLHANYSRRLELHFFIFSISTYNLVDPIPKMTTQPPVKRQKREEYRQTLAAQQQAADTDVADVKLPQKKFFRQRAHANPFSDHRLE